MDYLESTNVSILNSDIKIVYELIMGINEQKAISVIGGLKSMGIENAMNE